jgi:hypothetical protein
LEARTIFSQHLRSHLYLEEILLSSSPLNRRQDFLELPSNQQDFLVSSNNLILQEVHNIPVEVFLEVHSKPNNSNSNQVYLGLKGNNNLSFNKISNFLQINSSRSKTQLNKLLFSDRCLRFNASNLKDLNFPEKTPSIENN